MTMDLEHFMARIYSALFLLYSSTTFYMYPNVRIFNLTYPTIGYYTTVVL